MASGGGFVVEQVSLLNCSNPSNTRTEARLAKSVDVAVTDGINFIRWARNRPARVMPNGYLGAVVSGRVMPVYNRRFDSLSIDTQDNGHEPEECPFWEASEPLRFVDDDAKGAEADDIGWYMETNAYGHYVVFNGTEDRLSDVLRRLAFHGVGVRRHGTSHRPADNGNQYDWFIRLDFDGTREEAIQLVSDALSRSYSDSRLVDLGDANEVLRLVTCLPRGLIDEAIQEGMLQQDARSLVTWLGEIAKAARSDVESVRLALQEEIDRADAEISTLQNKYEDIIRISSHEKSKQENSIRSLNSEISALRRRLEERDKGLSSIADTEAENAKLRSKLADQDAIYDEWEKLEKTISSLRVDLQVARNENQILVSENQRMASRDTARARSGVKMWNLAVAGLKAFSKIEIHGDAADTIIERFPDPSSLFDILQRLNSGEEMPWKKIGGARDWFEIDKHINTGDSDRGRVYCTKLESGRMLAVIHHKKDDNEQQRFFGKLRDPSFRRNLTFDPR